MNIFSKIDKSLLGLYSTDSRFLEELNEVKQYYEFYEGRPEGTEDDLQDTTGQLWAVKDRDYIPTREVRNLTKKLIKKQGRFMTSINPSIVVKSKQGDIDPTHIDNQRIMMESILDKGKFWNKFAQAFNDCVIGKRVLLALIAEVDINGKAIDNEQPIKFRFYTMPEFTYQFDPNDVDKLVKVQIAYQDESTVGKVQQEQRWHKWIYELKEDGFCWATYMIVDGANQIAYTEVPQATNIAEEENTEEQYQKVDLIQHWNTGLNQLPCKVIFNDGLTGDIRGHSDIKDLMDMQNDYNKTISDYRDSLRFAMFDQTVFIDCDSTSIEGVVIAPGALMDIKTDPSLGDGATTSTQGKVQKVGSEFKFQGAADAYLSQLKKDMYEIMEQPLPESLVNVASGKALRMLYDDLITRCEEKWKTWDDMFYWLFDMIKEVAVKGNLYRDNPLADSLLIDTAITLEHNYPIPDDEKETKELAIKEVEANVRSRQSYMRDYGSVEEADKEFTEILDEMDKINTTENAGTGLIGGSTYGTEDNTQDEDNNVN